LGVPSLRAVTDPAVVDRLADPGRRRRAPHTVTDGKPGLQVAALLRDRGGADGAGGSGGSDGSDGSGEAYREIGRLLTQAHESLRDDFEVSWPEADAAVAAAV